MTDVSASQEHGQVPAPPDAIVTQPNIGRTLIEPLNHGLAAGCRKALELGVPAHTMVEMLLNHMASVVAMVEPPGAREGLMKDVVRQFSTMVNRHVEARHTTKSGLLMPGVQQ